eukprot:Skav214668  [mRNA]  locus=scaffold923:273191:275144:+ [translate_table: standard]
MMKPQNSALSIQLDPSEPPAQRKGAVGDCWFLSALAVVAQRPDLILRLFKGQTETRVDGRYTVQLFLDGRWDELVVDDQLPCVAQQTRSDGSQLAFSRAKERDVVDGGGW